MRKGNYVATTGQDSFGIRLITPQLLEIDGKRVEFDFMPLRDGSFSLILGTRSFVVENISGDGSVQTKSPDADSLLGMAVTVSIGGKQHTVTVDDDRSLRLKELSSRPHEGGASLIVHAPMPGLIVRLEILVGDEVVKGQGLLVLEAMKMENEIRANSKGRVKAIHVEKGRAVEKGDRLITIEEL